MFVRTKKIQNKQYAYLVENEWTVSGSRQRVKKYLGKVHQPDKKNIKEPVIDSMKEYPHIIHDLIIWELENHGFKHNNSILTRDNLTVNLHETSVRRHGKKSVIALNEGYLCDYTLTEALHFKPSTSQTDTSNRLATKTLEAGLKLPPPAFIQLFEKVFKDETP